MPNKTFDLSGDLRELKLKLGLLQTVECSKAETKELREHIKDGGALPDDIYESASTGAYLRYISASFTKEEEYDYLSYQHLACLMSIKACLQFIVGVMVVGIGIGILIGSGILG